MARTPSGPPLKFDRRERKKFTEQLEVETIEMIEAYPSFHAKETGEPEPTPGEVVDQITKKVLGGHKEFKKHLEEWRKNKAAEASGGGGSKGSSKGGARGGESSS